MRVAITGATGFVGTRLVKDLLAAGHDAIALTRSKGSASHLPAETEVREVDLFDAEAMRAALEGSEAVVHLAGANLSSSRWSKSYRKVIRESRVASTNVLVDALRALGEERPQALISGSAIGWYGPREADELCLEDELDAVTFAPRDYLSDVCRQWESAARRAELLGMRVVRLRTGVVLGKGDGALAQLETPFKMGVGGPIGHGKQMVSWIHLEDIARMIVWALENEVVDGPLNGTAPKPVTNKEFSSAIGRALKRPAFMPVPVPALRLLKGKIADMLATGQNVPPQKALALGFEFRYPTIDEALGAIYRPEPAAEAVTA